MARDLAALRQNVDQLIASQNQMARQMARLQSDLVDIFLKLPEPRMGHSLLEEPCKFWKKPGRF